MIFEHLPIDEWNPAVYLTAYIPDPQASGTGQATSHISTTGRKAILICPGGGYLGFNEQEMEPTALQFLAAGYCVFVLSYSVGAGQATLPTPIVELSKAIGKIRSQADRWQVDPQQIYTCGFSTGAHLALLQAEVCHADWLTQMTRLPVDMVKPNGLILGYPIIDLSDFESHLAANMPEQLQLIEMIHRALFGSPSPEKEQLSQWHWRTHSQNPLPPIYLWGLTEDKYLPPNAFEAMKNAFDELGMRYESHLFTGSAHGSGLLLDGSLMERAKFLTSVANFFKGL